MCTTAKPSLEKDSKHSFPTVVSRYPFAFLPFLFFPCLQAFTDLLFAFIDIILYFLKFYIESIIPHTYYEGCDSFMQYFILIFHTSCGMHSFLFLSNILMYWIYVFVYPLSCRWAFGLVSVWVVTIKLLWEFIKMYKCVPPYLVVIYCGIEWLRTIR